MSGSNTRKDALRKFDPSVQISKHTKVGGRYRSSQPIGDEGENQRSSRKGGTRYERAPSTVVDGATSPITGGSNAGGEMH